MDFRLKIMGTASAMPVVGRFQSAHILEICGRSFLIDCGEGVQMQLLRHGVSLSRIDAIFISHIHGDHIFGLFPLLSTMGMGGRREPLHIYGPSSLGSILKFFGSWFGQGMSYEPVLHPVDVKGPEIIYENNSLEVLALPLEHKIETYGYLFREKEPELNVSKVAIAKYNFTRTEIGMLKRGEDILRPAGPNDGATFMGGFVRNSGMDIPMLIRCGEAAYKPYEPRAYAYCSDTAPFPELAQWVRGVDLLYHECTYLEKFADQARLRHHSTTLDAASCAREAGVGRLVIGHYSSRCKDASLYEKQCRAIFPETYAAADGDVFEVPVKNPQNRA